MAGMTKEEFTRRLFGYQTTVRNKKHREQKKAAKDADNYLTEKALYLAKSKHRPNGRR